jgi:hypothetical protein
MEKLRVVTASFTWNTPAACDEPRFDWQLFALGYKDRRDVTARPDNSLRVATSADLALVTLGASHAGVWPVRRGRFETVVWSAWQTGDWYEQRHRAASALIEGGYEWTEMAGRPRARAGWLHASGDESPSDQWHRTFFPLLPATRPEVMEGTFAQMNARQLFASLRLSPHPRVNLSAEVRRLRLASGSDLWYSGSGATEREGRYFGFSGRLASGETALGTMLQGRADVAVHPRWRVSGAFAIVRGGEAVRRSFERHRLMVFTVESAFSLR